MSISIKNLPIVSEISTDDILLVQTPSQTGIIKFQDFIIGPEHVSFYKDIKDVATDVQILSASIAPYTNSFSKILGIDTQIENNSESISRLSDNINDLASDVKQLNSLVSALTEEVERKLETITSDIVSINLRIAAIEDNISTNTAAIAELDPH